MKKQQAQSQKIRSILYLLWNKNSEGMTSEEYYKSKTDKYIDFLMKKLDGSPLPKEDNVQAKV